MRTGGTRGGQAPRDGPFRRRRASTRCRRVFRAPSPVVAQAGLQARRYPRLPATRRHGDAVPRRDRVRLVDPWAGRRDGHARLGQGNGDAGDAAYRNRAEALGRISTVRVPAGTAGASPPTTRARPPRVRTTGSRTFAVVDHAVRVLVVERPGDGMDVVCCGDRRSRRRTLTADGRRVHAPHRRGGRARRGRERPSRADVSMNGGAYPRSRSPATLNRGGRSRRSHAPSRRLVVASGSLPAPSFSSTGAKSADDLAQAAER
jgi:hypothetical protein